MTRGAEQLTLWYERGRPPLSLTADDLARVWGTEHVHRFSAAEVEPLRLPAEVKSALVEMGLPEKLSWMAFVADTGEDGRSLGPIELPGRSGHWCRFAWAYNLVWCIESDSGEVWLMSPDWTQRDQFINSSLPAFLEFAFRFEIFRQTTGHDGLSADASTLDRLEADAFALDQLEDVLRNIDPRALSPGTGWASFFEETRLWMKPMPFRDDH